MASVSGSFPPQPGNSLPQKPWEQAGASSGPTPFNPPSAGSTSEVVEASGTAKSGEVVSGADGNAIVNRNPVGRPVPARPWPSSYVNNVGGYGSTMNYNTGYGSGMYGSYGGYGGSSYGGGLYGNNMYRSYGGAYGGPGMYGGGMYGGGYGGGYGGPLGNYGMGMNGPYGNQDPNNPNNSFGAPGQPPSFWMSLMRVMCRPKHKNKITPAWGSFFGCLISLSFILDPRWTPFGGLSAIFPQIEMQGVVEFFGRISFLIDQNTFALHAFMSALLQLFDRSGMLYGELARFVLRILGIKTRSRKAGPAEPGRLPGPTAPLAIEGPKADGGAWDNVWGMDGGKGA